MHKFYQIVRTEMELPTYGGFIFLQNPKQVNAQWDGDGFFYQKRLERGTFNSIFYPKTNNAKCRTNTIAIMSGIS